MKNRIFSTVALAALVSLAACAKDEAAEGEAVTEETTVETTAPVVTEPAPVVAPMTTDSMAAPMDATAPAAGTDTAAVITTP